MNEGSKIIGGIVFLFVAISLPVTIFLVNQQQYVRPQADVIQSADISPTTAQGCPAINSDGTSNICRPQSFCNPGETVKYEGNEMCTTSLGRTAFCCTLPPQ